MAHDEIRNSTVATAAGATAGHCTGSPGLEMLLFPTGALMAVPRGYVVGSIGSSLALHCRGGDCSRRDWELTCGCLD